MRRLLALGLALVAIGLLVPGFHHVRCQAVVAGGASADGGCQETFPFGFARAAAALGLVGVALVLGHALRAEGRERPRALLALAALAFLVPTALPLAGWASTGFDLAEPYVHETGNVQCSGALREPPFWLQTSMCVGWPERILVAAGVVAGALAAAAFARASPRLALAAVAVLALALAAALLAPAAEPFVPHLAWVLPALGALLVVAAFVMLRREGAGRAAA